MNASADEAWDQASLSRWHSAIGIPINFQEESDFVTFWRIELHVPRKVSRDVSPRVQMRRGSTTFSRFPTGFQTSLHLLRWKTSLHSSHCREIRPSFESGHLSIHSTWGSKLRVPVNYILLREGSSCGSCGKLAYFFNRILGISSLLETIWGAPNFPRVFVWNWCSSTLETGFSGNLWCFLKEVKPFFMFDVEWGIALEPIQGSRASSQVDLGYPSYFTFLQWHQCPRLVRVFLATLWSSIKQINPPSMFDWEHRIALHAMQGNRASSLGEGKVSWFFPSCSGNLGYIPELGLG